MPLPKTRFQAFVELLQERVQQQPEQTAFVFLKNGETESGRLSYGELEQRAKAIAVQLQAFLAPGERALLVYPYEAAQAFITGFLGCLYAGVVAVPCAAPRNRSGWIDLGDRLASSGAKILLSTANLLPKLKPQLQNTDAASLAASLPGLATDTPVATDPTAWIAPSLQPETLAFLQYTSGSTGKPKGVMVTHRSILQNQQMIEAAFGHSDRTIGVGWLPLFHDMGLIGNVLQVLYLGSYSVLMSPIDFVQKPVRWLQMISHYRGTTSGGPNFAYDLLCNRVTEAQRAELDLSCWQVAFSGAEPVLTDTLERFTRTFADCGFRSSAFYPCYGMAEATLFIAGGRSGQAPRFSTVADDALEENRVVPTEPLSERARTLISCGTPWLDGQIVIADPENLARCAPNQVGEIWVSGSGLGVGYWNMEEMSDRTFNAHLKDTGEGPFLRTGDLGFLQDGQLYITGRLHDVLVFWGLNHYPHHIEATVTACHPAFRPNRAAAFSVEVDGVPRLVIAQEVERQFIKQLTLDEVIEPIRWEVFQEHFIDVYGIVLLKPGDLPLTSSGKIQRRRCRELFLKGEWETLGEWRSPKDERSDMTGMLERYLNPMTHLRRFSSTAAGRLRRLLSGFSASEIA
ncbi:MULTISPECIES: fatty acyl-AMP ligase [unclassified Leptolyngbya]|uniref:fatty acyl-AMP ligase n=1 Tax=unclassified Leptolyngbya TaxID=2650499 RepID=UPI001684BB92|nr:MULTISPECIES: fatty acyl-AMP ligase [unclassified Leptolyngbya]MBD1913888.1 fatty acyl-AMP ligase [Leptolyngbya sp. FACHB-8]MBD2156340.1 fatty acyl-AMP ligase [Leptolyngbya sp. FACHB-16]